MPIIIIQPKPGETSRSKQLVHFEDKTLWRDTATTASFHPDKFQIFDGDNNIASDLYGFGIQMVEISGKGTATVYLIIDYTLHNHSWNTDGGDETVVISLCGSDGKVNFAHVTNFSVGRNGCHYGLYTPHWEPKLDKQYDSVYDITSGFELLTWTITSPIGNC